MSFLAKNYNRKKLSFIKGKGSFLYSTNGSKYLDFVQGIAVNSLGHAHPKLIKAINKQVIIKTYQQKIKKNYFLKFNRNLHQYILIYRR